MSNIAISPKIHNDCYELSENGTQWKQTKNISLSSVRMFGSSVLLNRNMVRVSGGSDGLNSALATSDISNENGIFKPSVRLPEPLVYLCIANINETHLFIAGNSFGTRKQTFVVDISVNPFKFLTLPPMLIEREGAACVTIIREEDVKLFVGGGEPSYGTTEFYNVQKVNWERGPNLPRGYQFGSCVNYPDSRGFLVIGGMNNSYNIVPDIMRYDPELNEFEYLPVELNTPRTDFGAVLIGKGEC